MKDSKEKTAKDISSKSRREFLKRSKYAVYAAPALTSLVRYNELL